MGNKTVYNHGPIGPWGSPMDFVTSANDKLGVAAQDTIKRFMPGTRLLTWDGTVFKYGKAGAVMTSYQAGAYHNNPSETVSYEAIGAASPVGGTDVTITEGSITEDQYAGGHIIIYHATGDGDIYMVESNEATVGTTTILHLDRPLAVAITTSDNFELYPNVWNDLRQGSGGAAAGFAGPPMSIIASGSYGWFKTRGIAFISPQVTLGAAYLAAAYWRHDGSVDIGTSAGAAFVTDQYAGYRTIGSQAGNGPLIMLQGSL